MPATSTEQQSGAGRISGTLIRLRFQNPVNGWFAADLEGIEPRGRLRVTGTSALALTDGFVLTCNGKWVSSKWGDSFQASTTEASPPKSAAGLRKYLCSGAFPGLGTRSADWIVDYFGEATLQVLDHEPNRIYEVPKLQRKTAKLLIEAWQGESTLRQIMVFCLSQGITVSQVRRIIKAYGNNAALKIKEDPYRLCRDIRGIGFRSADAIARKLGVAHDSPFRLRAALAFSLENASTEGHCAVANENLVLRCKTLLNDPGAPERNVSSEQIRQQIVPALSEGWIVQNSINGAPHLFTPVLFAAEQNIAQNLLRLIQAPPVFRIDETTADVLVAKACAVAGIDLAPEQGQAVRSALLNKVTIITGGPGVGKTTILKVLITAYELLTQVRPECRPHSLALCAPTGRAADRMFCSTARLSSTIHRLLEYGVDGFARHAQNPIDADVCFVDEYSMTDVNLCYAQLQGTPDHCRVIIIGDVDQIPSVGPGNVLDDLISSKTIPVVRLTKVYRQAATSDIIRVAHSIIRGVVPWFKDADTDCEFIECNDNEVLSTMIEKTALRMLERFSASDIQVLSPMKQTNTGTERLCELLRPHFNTVWPNLNDDSRKRHIVTGDRVMQTRNNYNKGVFNGDMGSLVWADDARLLGHEIPVGDDKPKPAHVIYARPASVNNNIRMLGYAEDELDEIQPAWACTFHRAQGSEFACVIIPCTTMHFRMLRRKLLYTGITRGKTHVVLVGSKRALRIAVENTDDLKRTTKLKEWLQQLCTR